MKRTIIKTIRKAFLRLLLNKQLLAVLMVFSIFVNGFVPRFNLTENDVNVLSQIMEQQTTLLRFFSLTTLPFNIVNQIFSDQNENNSGLSGTKSEKKKENKTHSSSDISIISLERSISIGKSNVQKGSTYRVLEQITGVFNFSRQKVRASPNNLNPQLFLCLAFLLVFFMLPRSSVADGYAANINLQGNYTQLGFSSWVFYLSNNNIFQGRVL